MPCPVVIDKIAMNINPKRTLLLSGGVLLLAASIYIGLTEKKPLHPIDMSPDSSTAQSSPLSVDSIIDGDTFILSDGRHVRLLGIDTPEIGEPYSDSAKIFANSNVYKMPVSLEFGQDSIDSYGRTLAYLYIDSLCYNELVLRRGFATLYLFTGINRHASKLIAAQNDARRAKRGIWSLPSPAPEDYYVAARDSYRFHRPLCPSIKNINLKNARRFKTRDEALDLGLSPCRNCRP